jgi:photosystem II stability/assembly factor-like uncharacterized protein
MVYRAWLAGAALLLSSVIVTAPSAVGAGGPFGASAMPSYGQWRSSRIGGGGFIQNVVLHPADAKRAYAYTDVSGPYRSDDGGNTWRMLQGNLPARRGNYSTRSLIVDPRNPDHFIAALGSAWDPQEGIYVSTDGGATFEQTLKASFVNGSRRNSGFVLERDPSNPDVVYAAAINTGVHRSDDNGQTWTALGPEGLNPGGLVVDRADPKRLWLSTVPGKDWVHQKQLEFPGGFYRSEDGGASWNKLDDEGPKEVLQDPKDPARLYGTFDKKPGVRVSADAGATWQPLVEGLDTSGATWNGSEGWNALAAGPDFVVVANGDGMFFRMPAGGAKWQRIERQGIDDAGWYASSENDRKDGGWTHFGKALGSVTIDPRDPNHWFFTDWYALYQTHDGGKNWKLSIDGIEVTVIHNLLQDPTDPGLVHLGMADNGYFRSTNGGETFDQVRLAANIKDLTASPKDPNRLWGVGPSEPGAWVANLVFASADRGQTWAKSPMEGLPDMGKHRCNSIAADPREAGVLYLAVSGEVGPDQGGVYRSDDGGGSWRWVGQGLPGGAKFFRDEIWAIGREIAIGTDGVLMAISRDGRHVYRYDPAAAEWAKADLDLPSGTRPMSASADWTTPGRFAIGVSGDAKAAGVYVSDDAGRSWRRTYDRTGASHVTFDRAVPNRAAAATMDGLIVSTDGARTWQALDRSLPERVDANPMAFAGDRLVIGSAGAGAFWIPLVPAAAAPVVAKPEPEKRALSFDEEAPAAAAPHSGVLANGDFSAGEATPDAWALGWKTTDDKFKLHRDATDFVSAPASMSFETIGGPAHGSAAQSLKLDRLGGDKTFRISLSAKSRPAGAGKEFELAQVVVQAMDEQYKQLSWEIVADLSGVRDWQQFSKRVRLPDKTRHATVMLMIQGDGKAWLDDVVVRAATPRAGAPSGEATAAAPAAATPAAMVDIQPPPSMMLLPAEWRRLPDVIAADPNAQAAQAALARVVARAEAALGRTPSPLRVLVYQGHLEAHPDRVITKAALGDMDHLRALSWASAATGDARYADKARQFLMAWVDTYEPTGNSINENKLDATITTFDLLRDRLSSAERERAETWLRKMAELQVGTGNIGENDNWGAKRLKIVLLIGAALGEQKWVDHGVAGAKRLVAAGLHPDGTSEDLHRRDAMSYHTSCLKNLMELALAARRSGVSGLYAHASPKGSSIRKSVEYVVPYAKGEQVHSEWDGSKEPLDRQRWEAGDAYYRPGKPWDRRRGREMFILASFFDARLATIVDLLGAVEPSPVSGPASADEEWLRVLLRTTSATTDTSGASR